MSTNEFEQVHLVAYGLIHLVDKAFHLLQGILAFGEKYPDKIVLSEQDDWYSLAYMALLKNLVIEVASLLGRAKYGNDSNCNFQELKLVLSSNSEKKQRYHEVIDDIDKMLLEYNKVIPSTLRNKVIAHKDLETLFCGEEYNVDLIGITRFLLEGYRIIFNVFELTVGATFEFPDAGAVKQKYEESMTLP